MRILRVLSCLGSTVLPCMSSKCAGQFCFRRGAALTWLERCCMLLVAFMCEPGCTPTGLHVVRTASLLL